MKSLSDIKRDLDLALDTAEKEFTKTDVASVRLAQLHHMVKRLRKAFDELVACLESMGSLYS